MIHMKREGMGIGKAVLLLPVLLIAAFPTIAAARTPITCKKLRAIDGDSIKCDGVNMRDRGDGAPFVSGYDTPEIRGRKCVKELALGRLAKKRMAALLKTPGVKIYDSGQVDKQWKRPLVWAILPDGRSIGSVLIAEGLARA